MSTWFRIIVAVVVRPGLWATATVQVVRMARPGWWRRAPFLPLPDREYLRFRMLTAYGGSPPPERPEVHDVLTYLRWCRAFPA